jgi:alanine racemase
MPSFHALSNSIGVFSRHSYKNDLPRVNTAIIGCQRSPAKMEITLDYNEGVLICAATCQQPRRAMTMTMAVVTKNCLTRMLYIAYGSTRTKKYTPHKK